MSTTQSILDAKPRWHLARMFFAARLGGRVRKVPLDAGFSCPNRDGTLSRAGCSFCNADGSGTGRHGLGQTLAQQWAALAPRALACEPRARLLAYLQAYSNTHASPQRLRAVLAETAALPGVAGLCLGTRPDCLDVGSGEARLDVLAAVLRLGLPFVQLDLGLQSADDAVLRRAGRGHDAACFAAAVRAAAERGVCVCAHLMHGLPGAGADDLARSVEFLNSLPIAAVKFHNVLVCRGTGLARLREAGNYAPPERDAYISALVDALSRLRADICVQRLFADPAPGELLAPAWAADKAAALDAFRREMLRLDCWQGRAADSPLGVPDFSVPYR